MRLARVIGTVVATRRSAGLDGVKLLVVQPLDEDRQPTGRPEVAADATAQAGPGHLVFMVASREGAQAMPERFAPVDLAITGLVDDVHVVEAARRCPPTATWRREE
ncbi:MAG TPA: EutN/CcmL family microcompartment protein [Thermoanaerobaculales bacterium]|nr:EutN/CcmL family microcompartment protein [Thermoanaerobaculales bacterium]HPA82733.1 EutN/CcmL family microcompartment protein [Thermoanaerobaculales bacterium]HQL31009.1 EutN/CcmL family microcompartment protein [Thermoanaerobaculales bacterium]HQN96626.1 EutN/CcmL family microcompartment protein [Thermoanaerobaculales bacterium]